MAIFTGAGVAIVTPMHENGDVNYEKLSEILEEQIAGGTDAIIICGTTGESSTLTHEEHLDVIRYTVEKVAKRIPVIAGTGSNCTATAIYLSQEAEKAGADALLLVTPYYNKATQNGLIAHYTAIAESVKLPIVLYNVPSRTGCNIQPQTAVYLAKNVENIVAIKEASGDISQVATLMQMADGCIDLYSGNDDQIVPMMSLGAKGVISVLSNVAPKETHDIVALYNEGKVKESCDLPVFVTMTFQEDGRTLYGTSPETAMVVLQEMGVDGVGINCSTGPDKMVDAVKSMKRYAKVPVIVKPNAGLPALVDGETVYDMGPDEFARAMKKLAEAGATVLGGCCGTTPEHICCLKEALKEQMFKPLVPARERTLTTERNVTSISLDGTFTIVGERINPTGKKALQEQLRQGQLDLVVEMAEEQVEKGARILDVNMGMNGIDEKEMMLKAVQELTMTVDVPLSIDSSYVEVVEQALRIYPGRALINSISLETEKFEKLIPIARKYGAMFILLPLSNEGLPKDLDEKIRIIDTIVASAKDHGLSTQDIVVDGLVATIGANKRAALEVFETIHYCKEELGSVQYILWSAGEGVCEYSVPYGGYFPGTDHGNRQSVPDSFDQCSTGYGSFIEQRGSGPSIYRRGKQDGSCNGIPGGIVHPDRRASFICGCCKRKRCKDHTVGGRRVKTGSGAGNAD